MSIDSVRQHCLSFPSVTETVQWGDNLVFKVCGKVFAILALEPGLRFISFKCTPQNFIELTERPGIVQGPHLARGQWVALESEDALSPAELRALLREAYDLISAKLPKKLRATLLSSP
jgi:predicted DNA-binding protein (MmcQ/YjbR family)